MQYLDSYNIHETFVKVPQSHYIHNKVVKFVLSQDRQKKITQLFSKLETVLHQLAGIFFFSGVSGAEIRPHSQWKLGDFFANLEEKIPNHS